MTALPARAVAMSLSPIRAGDTATSSRVLGGDPSSPRIAARRATRSPASPGVSPVAGLSPRPGDKSQLPRRHDAPGVATCRRVRRLDSWSAR